MDDSEEGDLLRDEEPDVDLINDTERDMRLMREADVKAGRLCATCQRAPPTSGGKECEPCFRNSVDDFL